MLEKIIEKIDFKWWTSLEAQQKLTVGMAIIIFALAGINLLQFRSAEKSKDSNDARYENLRLSKNIEIASEKAGKEACYESQILYLQENEKRYQELFFKTQNLKQRLNEKPIN